MVFPVISFKRDELKLRGDIVYAIERVGLRDDDFIYWDECRTIKEVQVSLVDHNAVDNDWLKGEDVSCEVVDIVDHHADSGENVEGQNMLGRKEIVVCGSCSSLVLRGNVSLMGGLDAPEREFCMGALMVDTGGLRRKVEAVDREVWEDVVTGGGEEDALRAYGATLGEKRRDVGGLDVYDLLRRDWKQWGALGIASVGVRAAAWGANGGQTAAEMAADVVRWGRERGVAQVVVMTAWEENGALHRELGVGGVTGEGMVVDEGVQRELGLEGGETGVGGLQWWRQRAVEKSRKQVAPVLVGRCEGGV